MGKVDRKAGGRMMMVCPPRLSLEPEQTIQAYLTVLSGGYAGDAMHTRGDMVVCMDRIIALNGMYDQRVLNELNMAFCFLVS